MPGLTITYSHAAPYIRHQMLNAASSKLATKTQRDKRYYTGVMHGLTLALGILLKSPEGQDSPKGYPEFHGATGAYDEIARFVGGEHEMRELGFIEETI